MAFVDRFFIWDTESTSNKPTEDDIISIGGVLCKYNSAQKIFEKVAEFHTYVQTKKKIDTVAQSIHHITKADLYNQPAFPEAVEILRTFLQQYQPEGNSRLIMVAHNGSKFDDIILYCNFVQNRLNFDDFLRDIKCYGFLDTLKYFRSIFKKAPSEDLPKDAKTGRVSFALGHIYTSYCGGDKLENAHDALVDSQALFDIFNSKQVVTKIHYSEMFKSVVRKVKAVNWVKQTAGVAFQDQEHHTRMQGGGPPSEGGHRKRKAQEMLQHEDEGPIEPVFEQLREQDLEEGQDPNQVKRLCMCCTTFVLVSEHKQCDQDPQPVTKRSRVEKN